MNQEQIKQKLLSLRAEILAQEVSVKHASDPVELDQSRVGRLSRMDAMQSQQMAMEAARRRQQQLSKIDGALQRIESDDYGDCFLCGEAIDGRRLSVDPTNTRCVECAEK